MYKAESILNMKSTSGFIEAGDRDEGKGHSRSIVSVREYNCLHWLAILHEQLDTKTPLADGTESASVGGSDRFGVNFVVVDELGFIGREMGASTAIYDDASRRGDCVGF